LQAIGKINKKLFDVMKKISLKAVALVFAFLPLFAISQDCVDYHKKNCVSKAIGSGEDAEGYKYNIASKSALMFKGQSSEFRFDIHQGKDYRISICSDPVLGKGVTFQIFDFEENTLLYDSQKDNYAREFEFSVLMTRNVKIIINVPADETTKKSSAYGLKQKNTQMGCVGVLIESMITVKTGF